MRVVAIVMAASFCLAGCSTNAGSDPASDPASDPTSSTAAAPSTSPSANILDNAIESTVSRGTARIIITIEAAGSQVTGTGSTSLANNRGEITWVEAGTDDSWTDLISTDGTYTFVDESWFLAPKGTQTPTSGNISPLSQLGNLTSADEDSLTGTVALTVDSGLNFSDEELTELATTCEMKVVVDVALDSAGLISSIIKTFNCVGDERVSRTQLSDFGLPINLSTPEDAFEVNPNQ